MPNMSTTNANFKIPSRNIIVTRKKSELLKQSKTIHKREPKRQTNRADSKQKTKAHEYYPGKAKRNLSSKKVTLKPKDKLETILSLDNYSKRKSTLPRKKDPNDQRAIEDDAASDDLGIDDLSMAEVIRIKENTEGLSDEDLMEILTCPSPVWWEDPPNEFYEEEAICISKPSNSDKVNEIEVKKGLEKSMIALKRSLSKENKTLDIPVEQKLFVPAISIEKRDQNFLKKRSTLENLLNNLKKDDKDAQDVTILKNVDKDVTVLKNIERDVTLLDNVEGDVTILKNVEEDVTILKNVDKDVTVLKNIERDVTLLDNVEGDVTILKNVEEDVTILKNVDKDITIFKNVGKDTIVEPSTCKSYDNTNSPEIFSEMAMEVLDDLENLDIPMAKKAGKEMLELTECMVIDSPEIEGTTKDTFLGSGKDTHTIDPLCVQNAVKKKDKHTILIKKNTLSKIKPNNFIKLPNGKNLSEMSHYLPLLANIKKDNDIRRPLAIDFAGISKNTTIGTISNSNVKIVTNKDIEKRNVIQNNGVQEAGIKIQENCILNGKIYSNENEKSNLNNIKLKIKDAYMKFLRESKVKKVSETSILKENTLKNCKKIQENNTDSPVIAKDDVPIKNKDSEQITAGENNSNKLKVAIPTNMANNREVRYSLRKIEKIDKNEMNETKTSSDVIFENANNDKIINNLDKETTVKQSKRKAAGVDKMDVDIAVYTDICKAKTKKTDLENYRKEKLSEIYRKLREFAAKKQINKQIINICNSCKLKLFNPMIISDQNKVKYCFKCSSIFDSNDCKYCLLGTNTIQIKNPYNCDQCKYLCCCVDNLKKHQKLHIIVGGGVVE